MLVSSTIQYWYPLPTVSIRVRSIDRTWVIIAITSIDRDGLRLDVRIGRSNQNNRDRSRQEQMISRSTIDRFKAFI
ncbi:hypothetical protein [Chamaesiphon sp.]|uniref:hypothetical protein n=1 Tax=Chamaesiphon sp. TaxID=2814140 RepID=UPI003592FDC8